MRPALAPTLLLSLVAAVGCGSPDAGASTSWSGSIDTLASGQIVVRNPATPIRSGDDGWRVVEELRLGRMEGGGADVFGQIASLEVDAAGRLWVLDSQAQELRVFDASGEHVRTTGRRGGGPGEFAQAVRVELAPDGHMWVMDPQNNRISVFDTAGAFVRAEPALGGFIMMPWPGRFDADGFYYAPVPRSNGDFSIALVRHDVELTPLDTLVTPTDPVERERFEHSPGPGSFIRAGIPFQGGLSWQLSPRGTMWAMISDEYRLIELTPSGDTLRTITREFSALPVTDADREQARENLRWFTNQGGQIDLSRLPRTKAPVRSFFQADDGHIWVARVTNAEESGRVHDVFDPEGRFLTAVRLPFPLSSSPQPVVRDGVLHGVTQDDLEVQYVVRARVVRP